MREKTSSESYYNYNEQDVDINKNNQRRQLRQ